MIVKFNTGIPVGLDMTVANARFRFLGLEPHVRRDGTDSALSVWQGWCAECGAEFITRAPSEQFPESRRCPAHKKPGKAVRS